MKLYLISGGMFFLGLIIHAIFGMQILIIKKCSMKLYDAICHDYEFWYPESCRKYLNSVKRKNTILILVLIVLSFAFIPSIGFISFVAGLLLARLTSGRKAGLTDANVEETIKIFVRFVNPGKAEEFEELLYDVVAMVRTNSLFGFS